MVLNLAPQPGETAGFSPHKHLEVLAGHAPALTVDVVLADTKAAGTGNLADLEKAASMLGARLVTADVAADNGTPAMSPSSWRGRTRKFSGCSARHRQGGVTPMAMTSVVKDELSRVPVIKPCCRKAEVSTLLRFAGGLHLAEGRVVIEAELDTGAAARRLRAAITEVFGHPAEFLVLAPSGLRKGSRYLVRVDKGQAGESLARQAGLIDATAARCAACPGRWCPALPATARRPGAARSWRTAR